MAYSSQARVESYLGRPLTSSEASLINLILESVDSWINNQIQTEFGNPQTETRYYDGGNRILNIDQCRDITAINLVDSLENTILEYVVGDSIEARPRNDDFKTWLESRVGKFPCGVANVAVTATFGGGTVPNDIVYLATILAADLINKQSTGNLKSESIEGYSRTFADFTSSNSEAVMILEKYTANNILI